MRARSKGVYIFISFIACFSASKVYASEKKPKLFNDVPEVQKEEKAEEAQGMKSLSWDNSKLRKQITTDSPPEPKEGKMDPQDSAKEETDKSTPESDETESATDQEIWEKYRALAEGGKKKASDKNEEPKDSPKNEEQKEALDEKKPEETSEETKTTESGQQKQQAIGLQKILQDYKNSQGQESGMSTRSFGKID